MVETRSSEGQNRLVAKISSRISGLGGGSPLSWICGNGELVPGLRISNPQLVVASSGADLRTTKYVEERTTKQNLEGGVIYDLNLEPDCDVSNRNRLFFDEAQRVGCP